MPRGLSENVNGNRTRLTDESVNRLCEAIYPQGADNDTACAAAGIPRASFYRWQARGRELIDSGERPRNEMDRRCVALVQRVDEARANAELAALTIIQAAARRGTWQAAAWWLERTRPDRYALRGRVELTGEGGGPVEQVTTVQVAIGRPAPALEEVGRTLAALIEAGAIIDTTGEEA